MSFELKLTKVDNGYIAEYWEEERDGYDPDKAQIVFEEGDEAHGHIECFARLLRYVCEYFGMEGSKHDARRIRILTGADDE